MTGCEIDICRACGHEAQDYRSLYKQGVILGEVTTLATLLTYCTSIEFSPEEDLPKIICEKCVQQLGKAYKFKQQVHQANEKLHHAYQPKSNEFILGGNDSDETETMNNDMTTEYVTLHVIRNIDGEEEFVINESNDDQAASYAAEEIVQEQIVEMKNEVLNEEIVETVDEDYDEYSEGMVEDELEDEVKEDQNQDYAEELIENDSIIIDDLRNSLSQSPTPLSKASDMQSDGSTDNKIEPLPKLKPIKGRSARSKNKVNNPDLQCKICGKQLSNPNSFKYHMQLHSDTTPFLCSLCGEGFKTRNAYDGHIVIHDPNNPNKCEICFKTYRQASSLRSHMLTHTGERPFVCNICGKGMTQKSGYKKHMLTHTGEKPHVCDFCGRKFRYSSNLIAHRRSHTGEKPYECPACNKCFISLEQLKRHKLVHSGERPYSCDLCEKRFKRRTSLVTHQHTHDPLHNTRNVDKKINNSNVVELI